MYKENRFIINVPSNSPAYNILFGPWLRYCYTSQKKSPSVLGTDYENAGITDRTILTTNGK